MVVVNFASHRLDKQSQQDAQGCLQDREENKNDNKLN